MEEFNKEIKDSMEELGKIKQNIQEAVNKAKLEANKEATELVENLQKKAYFKIDLLETKFLQFQEEVTSKKELQKEVTVLQEQVQKTKKNVLDQVESVKKSNDQAIKNTQELIESLKDQMQVIGFKYSPDLHQSEIEHLEQNINVNIVKYSDKFDIFVVNYNEKQKTLEIEKEKFNSRIQQDIERLQQQLKSIKENQVEVWISKQQKTNEQVELLQVIL